MISLLAQSFFFLGIQEFFFLLPNADDTSLFTRKQGAMALEIANVEQKQRCH